MRLLSLYFTHTASQNVQNLHVWHYRLTERHEIRPLAIAGVSCCQSSYPIPTRPT